MDPARLHPELGAYRRMPVPPIAHRWQRAIARGGITLLPAVKPSRGVRIERLAVPGGRAAHVFTPPGYGEDAPGAALLWIHGGGMVIGAAAQDDARCLELAAELGILVVSVEYRLAPEHPYPAPLDDCAAAWRWLHDVAGERRVDPARIAIGGQSAGGGLAAGLVLRLHDEGGPQPAAQWLFCPMLDDRTAADRSLDAERHYLWDNRANLVGWTAYLGGAPGGRTAPDYASPSRRIDLAGLPPAWIGTGDIELFFAEDRDYGRSLAAAGVDTTLDVVTGAPHAFESLAAGTEVARAYSRRARSWLRSRLGLAP